MVSTSRQELFESLEQFLLRMFSLAQADSMTALFEFDLSYSQIRATLTVAQHGEPMSIGDIAEHMGVSVAAAGRTVDQLVRLKIAERRESPDDRRVKLVSLSERGLDLADQHTAAKREAIRSFVARLPEEDCERLAQALSPILAGVCLRSIQKD